MAGFRQDPIQFINLIADNLRDRYQSGFPVLKELIQNTDDAPATELHYGITPGLQKAEHPLLKGSGLFFINNGGLKKTDYDGIRSFGQNSKAADQTCIGKFGLGMKSVFHFCETFFFLTLDEKESYAEVLNPWSGPDDNQNIHRDWDDFSDQDAQIIRNHLVNITRTMTNADKCFVLWLPLRKKAHLRLPDGKESGSIVSEYPGDDSALLNFLAEESLPIKLASLLPMLQHIKQIFYWNFNDNDVVDPIFKVTLNDPIKRPSLIETASLSSDSSTPKLNNLNGKICVNQSSRECVLEYFGLEKIAWNHALTEMHDHELWPSSHVRDSLGRSKVAKDKARPHGAVFFSKVPGNGKLITNWSVFLPLDEEQASETIPCAAECEFRVTLHGYFFIDAGRQGIHGLNDFDESNGLDSEDALRKAWNWELLQTVVLPLLLPSLEKFHTELAMSDKDCIALFSALNNSQLMKQFKKHITVEYNWLREITPKGLSWSLQSHEKKVLRLPQPPVNDGARPWRLFGSLKGVAQQYCLSVEGAPNIVHSDSEANWSESDLIKLLKSIQHKDLFSDDSLLSYFTKFLDCEAAKPYLGAVAVKQLLANLIRQGLLNPGENQLGKNQKRIQNIVGYLRENQRFEVANSISPVLLRKLLDSDCDVVLIPKRFFASDLNHQNSLSVENATKFLRKIDGALNDEKVLNNAFQEDALKISEQFINAVSIDARADLLQRCADLHVLGAYDCKEDQRVPVSVRKLQSAENNDLLFGYGQGINRQERLKLAPLLQKVLPRDRVFVINAETAKLALNEKSSRQSCDPKAVLDSLGHQARCLGDMQARIELAGQIVLPDSHEKKRGLRFLLHASCDHFGDDTSILWILGGEQHPVWKKMWAQLENNDSEPWNLLDSSIANKLSGEVSKAIGINEIRATSVIDEIKKRGVSAIDTAMFGQEECEEVLRNITDDDRWKSWPFHWTTQGKPVAGNAENSYLNSGSSSIDERLLNDVHLICCSRNRELARRQKDLLKPLDQKATIEIALNHPASADFWQAVMDAMHSLERASESCSDDLASKIKTSAWLPSGKEKAWKPEDIVDLEGSEAELDRILAQAPDTFATPLRLSNELQHHPFYSSLRIHYFSHDSDGLERLALVINDLNIYHLGDINIINADELQQSTKILSDCGHNGWKLLAHLIDKVDPELCFDKLLPCMNHTMELKDIVKVLQWVVDHGKSSKASTSMFNKYLKLFAETAGANNALAKLRLLNQAGCWKPSGELVSGVSGVATTHMLDREQASILSKITFQEDLADKIPTVHRFAVHSTSNCALQLGKYFEPWEYRVEPSLIAAFVLLFGCDDSIKKRCEDYLRQHSRDWLIEQFPWKKAEGIERGRHKDLEDCDLLAALEHFQMTVQVHDDNDIQAFSILGEDICVGLEKDFTTLLLGKPAYAPLSHHSGYQVNLILRTLDVEQCSDKQLSEYLRQSITDMLKSNIYEQSTMSLDELWNAIDISDQVDLDLARALILQNIPFYLKQLGSHKEPSLKACVDDFRDKEKKELEFQDKEEENHYRREKEAALKKIQCTIESDKNAQRAILESVRNKIQDFQYQEESVPFELFQNADDALRDLERIKAYPGKLGDPDVEPLPPTICKFVVDVCDHHFVFMHWGRTINQCGGTDFPGKDEGFDRDLENMLILNASDKGNEATGKFGLGFKSVWLISDNPAIVSGRVRTEIIGGLLPGQLPAEISSPLIKSLSKHQNDRQWPGTAIKLPLVDKITANQVINPFSNFAGVMVAFARNMRSVEIHQRGDRSTFNWEPRRLPGCENIFIGHLCYGGEDHLVMKISLADGAILLVINAEQGFIELPKEMPSLWVTAPIKEQERLGFAVNAMFDVDAGRSRLAANQHGNRELANKLGKQLGTELDQMREAVESGWDDVVATMQLSPEMKPYDFWLSLWRVLMVRLPNMSKESGARVIASEMLCEGLKPLAEEHQIIPNGLPGELQNLVRWQDIKTIMKGSLSDDKILDVVAKADCFQSQLNINHSASSAVEKWLQLLRDGSGRVVEHWVDLTSLIKGVVEPINPHDANTLGKVLNSDWEKFNVKATQEIKHDFNDAVEKSKELKFISSGDEPIKAQHLLIIGKHESEESKRGIFAPISCHLSGNYSEKGTDFFRLCRNRYEASSDKLKEWILQADDIDRRKAALMYLVNGDLSKEVAEILLKHGLSGTWLEGLDEDSKYLTGMDQQDRIKLLYQALKTPVESERAFCLSSDYPNTHEGQYQPPIESINAHQSLHNIYDWWEKNKFNEIEKYHKRTYPDGRLPDLSDDGAGNIDRSSWLVLLLLGGFHTMGRTNLGQHRSFIERAQRKKWWDVFIAPDPSKRFEEWMGVLDEFIGSQVDQQEYEQWMMRFPMIYKLSRYLEEYVELLFGLERYQNGLDLNLVLSPKADPDQQGGGISAPPLGNTLGIGVNFVIREMVRLRVIKSRFLHEHAFVPSSKVRELIQEMGGDIDAEDRFRQSPAIFEFLSQHMGAEKALFLGDYDIPLRIVALDENLQHRLLGRSLTREENSLW